MGSWPAWTWAGSILPGRIARQRNHPQADAIAVCGWCGAITLGILSPLAFIWAYTNPQASLTGQPVEGEAGPGGSEANAGKEAAS